MSRNKARENRRIKAWNAKHGIKEERLDLRDSFGIKDPTPYEAVKTMIRKQSPAQAY